MSKFVHKSTKEQVQILIDRNMKVEDTEKAEQTLNTVSYYKIKEFATPFLIKGQQKQDYNSISFERIISRYYQDKNLRISLLHAIEDIEVALQTQISHVLGQGQDGAYGYLNFSNWCNKDEYCKHYLKLREQEFKNQLRKSVSKSTSREISDKMKLDKTKYPPIWLAVSLLTFGQLVNLVELMSMKNLSQISIRYECTNKELVSWLKCLNLIRNICAHNSNIIDIKLKTTPIIRHEWKEYLFELKENTITNRVAIPILITHYLIHKINAKYHFNDIATAVVKLIQKDDGTANYFGFKDSATIEKIYPKVKMNPRKKRRNHNNNNKYKFVKI